jgi:hypothetical protein
MVGSTLALPARVRTRPKHSPSSHKYRDTKSPRRLRRRKQCLVSRWRVKSQEQRWRQPIATSAQVSFCKRTKATPLKSGSRFRSHSRIAKAMSGIITLQSHFPANRKFTGKNIDFWARSLPTALKFRLSSRTCDVIPSGRRQGISSARTGNWRSAQQGIEVHRIGNFDLKAGKDQPAPEQRGDWPAGD